MTNHNSWEKTFFPLFNFKSSATTIMGKNSLPSPLLSNNPLFSTLITLYILILLYFPFPLLTILLSPLLISFSILLFLLRLGTSQQLNPHNHESPTRLDTRTSNKPQPQPGSCDHGRGEMGLTQLGEGPNPHCYWDLETQLKPEPGEKTPGRLSGTDIPNQEGCQSFEQGSGEMGLNPKSEPESVPAYVVGWELGAPLEVIYEAYEGEEGGGDEDQNNDKVECYPSLSRFYPESDSDSDTDSSSSSWEGEREGEFPKIELWNEEREELIEISLDYNYEYHKGFKKKMTDIQEVQVDDDDEDEDNLIEIDISPTRTS